MYDAGIALVGGGEAPNLCDALQMLWLEYHTFWRERKKRGYKLKCFTPTTISLGSSENDYPTLQASVKAMKSKLVLFWICSRCIIHSQMDDATPYQKETAQAAHHLLSYISLLDEADLFLNDVELQEALRFGWSFLRWYQHLAFVAHSNEHCHFKLRPKLHCFGHQLLELQNTCENPAKQALWAAEDLVGQVKKLGKKTHKLTTHLRVAQRRSLFVSLRARRAHRDKNKDLRGATRNCAVSLKTCLMNPVA